ncbi:D-alanyl-D-alanine carboxypeptidase [Verrucomicrobiaceae bacterium N1E253]|uniref:D-alanyl-D-alanine carboxypeptidase n=1 Tax=Oceaniferula marina TaxID=2748318 RepID=A0A851GG40_9BACT|nr:serine hydrolase [Oceaniferula marina]NWK54235.1 D-alanyl-D-alanine carboxypeptidase [Oceaniferula marina]
MKPIFLILFTLLTAFLPLAQAKESYLVMEAHSNRVLLAYNSEQKRPVASLNKITSVKVVLDWVKASQANLTTLIPVPQAALALGGPNPMGLQPGDQLSIRDAIYSAMLGSDNIAMFALSQHVGQQLLIRRQIAGDPQKTFVAEMNTLSKALGMRRTKFKSSHGLEVGYWKGHSTAADIARICVHVMRDTGFGFYVKQRSRKISVVSPGGQRRSFTVQNTNKLLGQLNVNGIKTGMTAEAGQCLAINAHKSPLVKKLEDGKTQIRGRDLVVVILGSSDRFGRARQLIPQGWNAFDQWGAAGYPISESRREYLVVPQL